jgi:hypothetical protein
MRVSSHELAQAIATRFQLQVSPRIAGIACRRTLATRQATKMGSVFTFDRTGTLAPPPAVGVVALAHRELQFEIALEIMRRCICSESTARFFLRLQMDIRPVSRANDVPAPAAWAQSRYANPHPSLKKRPSSDRHRPGICNINKAIFRS